MTGVTKQNLHIPEPFLQKHLEELNRVLREITDGRDDITLPEYRGALVRTVARLGWIDGVTADDVGDLPPGVVTAISDTVQNTIAEAQKIPKGF